MPLISTLVSKLADDQASALSLPTTNVKLGIVYQSLFMVDGTHKALDQQVTVGQVLSLILATPWQPIHELLIKPGGPDPTDPVFQNAGISSLAAAFYSLSAINAPSITQDSIPR
jgi:hypothetical protein